MTEGATLGSLLFDYWRDAGERSLLFLDILRQRGNDYLVQSARTVPNVLNFEAELVLDGRTLERPVNYILARIIPPKDVTIDPRKRPFIVFDPRAGHGPGIGGMKHDSEIGVALRAGHPCYFVGFLPEPQPGQTIEDVCRAEAQFVKTVIERHKDADGKPVLIGNCQAGWQIMMMAAMAPDLPGPILIAGTPLSYWAGVHGKYPMRYLGGMLGGTWLTELTSDLGDGIFDGAWLISNFESNNPANTYWTKQYNVYSKADTEGPRYLEFEKWWGNPVLLNGGEIQFIVDELFVGNRLTAGEGRRWTASRVDLRRDHVADHRVLLLRRRHHAAAAGARLDSRTLSRRRRDRRPRPDDRLFAASEHRPSRHLRLRQGGEEGARGIHVQHGPHRGHAARASMRSCSKEADDSAANPELISGKYIAKLEPRTLDDIRALGCNDAADRASL